MKEKAETERGWWLLHHPEFSVWDQEKGAALYPAEAPEHTDPLKAGATQAESEMWLFAQGG